LFHNSPKHIAECRAKHPSPDLCVALQVHVAGHLWDLWNTSAHWRSKRCAAAGVSLSDLERRFPPLPAITQNRPDVIQRPHSAGPGTHLQRLIHTAGLRAAPGCKCKERAKLMDQRGPKWCRENIATIIGWLKEEHVRAREANLTRLPWNHLAARAVVELAIRKAERGVT
jgi:hypothetical protein